ncbi:dermonecrotic toxin domain-containing protein [Pseudomonas spelaei]
MPPLLSAFQPSHASVQQNSHAAGQPVASGMPSTPKDDQPCEAADTRPRARRSAPRLVSMETPLITPKAQKAAEAQVKQADRVVALQLAATLMNRVVSLEPGGVNTRPSRFVSDIPRGSTFGLAWSRLTAALKAEPFASYAKTHHIDTSRCTLDHRLGTLQCNVDGKLVTFGKDLPGWAQVSAQVMAVARELAPTLGFVVYAGEQSTRYELIQAFYGASYANTKTATLDFIRFIQRNHSFPALYSETQERVEIKPEYAAVKQRQLDAIQTTACRLTEKPETASPQQAGSWASRVNEADLQLARSAGSLLWEEDLPVSGREDFSRASMLPPEDSTMGQLLKALDDALAAPAFQAFATKHNIVLESINVAPHTGDLMCEVYGANGEVTRTVFTMGDASGWSAVAGEIVALAKSLAAGSTTAVRNPLKRSATYPREFILNFYAQSRNFSGLKQKLEFFCGLIKEGFSAARISNPTSDERSRAFQEKRRAVIAGLENPGPANPDGANQAALDPASALLRTLFAGEPRLHTLITQRLDAAIKSGSNGTLDVDSNHVTLAQPDPDNPGQFIHTPLVQIALARLTGNDTLELSDQDKLFDTRPGHTSPTPLTSTIPLDVAMGSIRLALRELPALLNDYYAEARAAYWEQPAFGVPASGNTGQTSGAGHVYNGSRKALLSDLLRENLLQAGLNQPGLDDLQREAIDTVVRYPEASTRPEVQNRGKPDVYAVKTGATAEATPNLLIHRLVDGRPEIFLLVEPDEKITPYDSADALAAANIHFELPLTDNIFAAQAASLINRRSGTPLASNTPAAASASTPTPEAKLPGWIETAGDAERFVLRDLSLQLASFIRRHQGRLYNSGIPTIRSFALSEFNATLPSPRLYTAEDLEVVFKTPVGTLSNGFIERKTMSLADALLQNLSGLPDGQIEVFYKPGNVRITALEKEGALKKIIQDLDIGKRYGELLKRELLDDPTTKAQRMQRFAQGVPIDLKIKALELATKGQQGVDTTGFRFITQILKAEPGTKIVDGQEIVIRPLAFDRKADGKVDVVENMYLIEPKDPEKGPHVLYRPLISDAPLMQFSTREALLEAIQKPGKLQQDVLAWLPGEDIRKIYTGEGFTHPNLIILGFNTGTLFTGPAPATPLATDGFEAARTLQQKLQDGQLMSHLYEAHVRSLLTLADEQSTSNEESRWASLKKGGYLLLNAVLPALRGPGAVIGAALQLDNMLNDIEKLSGDDQRKKEAAAADLLVNFASVLAHFQPRSATSYLRTQSIGQRTESRLSSPDPVPAPDAARYRIRLGGPVKDVTPVDGEIQTFVDEYNGARRINIIGHAAEPAPGQPARILGENEMGYSAEQVNNELLARGIDIRDYPNARAFFCYSGHGGAKSFASALHSITGVPVKGFEGQVITELTDGEFPADVYQRALAANKAKYPQLCASDIEWLAKIELDNTYAEKPILANVFKQQGTPIEVNVGTLEQPVYTTINVDYRPVRFGPPKQQSPAQAPVRHTGKELRSLAEYQGFKRLSESEKIAESVAFSVSDDAQFEYFLDGPKGGKETRLNIVGHGDKGGVTFKSDLAGAHTHTPESLARLIAPLLQKTGATRIRLLSCKSAATGFAQALSEQLNVPVKAPVGTVSQFQVAPDRYWFLEKHPNPRRPHDHEWKTFEGASDETQAPTSKDDTSEAAPPAAPQKVDVSMGYSHTVEDGTTVLTTRSLTDCSAVAVLTDLKDGIYQKRTLMHLTGSNLEHGLLDEDAQQLVQALNRSLDKGGKVIFVGGVSSDSAVGMGVIVGQEYEGRKPLLELLKKPGVQTTIASSVGVTINPDGTFNLVEGTGKGVFNPNMVRDVMDFAVD